MAGKKKTNKSPVKLSASRINTFLQCKLKYKYNYIDHLPKVSSPAFKLGNAVHESLEFAGNIWKEKGEFSEEDTEKIMDKFNEVSVREGIENYNVHRDGQEMVKRRLENFADANEKILDLEKLFGMKGAQDIYTKDGVPLIGAIDKVAEYDTNTLLVVDYKTLSTAPTSEDIRGDAQLSLYDLVARQLYPGYDRVILSLDLLRHDPIYTYRTKEEREYFEKYLKAVHDEMSNFDPSVDARPTLNQFCSWCDFRNYCEEYREACRKSNYKFLELHHADNNTLFNEWERIKHIERIIKNRKEEVSKVVMHRIEENGTQLDNGNGEELYIRQNSRVDYDARTIYDAIPSDEFINLISVKKGAVDKFVNNNPVFKRPIEQAGTVNFNKPFVDKRKSKKDDSNSKKNNKNKKK